MRYFSLLALACLFVRGDGAFATSLVEDGMTLQKTLSNTTACPVITPDSRFFKEGYMLDTTSGITVTLNGTTYEVLPNQDRAPFPKGKGKLYVVSNFANALGYCRYAYAVTKDALTTPYAKGSVDTLHARRKGDLDSFGVASKKDKESDKDAWQGTFILRPVQAASK